MVVPNECVSTPLLYNKTDQLLREPEDDYANDDDDALSLCDLPVYSGSSSNSFSSLKQYEYQEEANSVFEFFSGEINANDSSPFQENDAVIFCGKLIGGKDEVDLNLPVKPKKKSALFSWKRFKIKSLRKSASKKKAVVSAQAASCCSSKTKSKLLHSTGSDLSQKITSATKVSSLLTCPTKSRWYLFMFGQTRFPQAMTMDLGDLKNRQQRRICSRSQSINLRESTTEGGGSGSGSGRGRGIWSLLKESATSVGMTNPNDVVRAVGCMSLV